MEIDRIAEDYIPSDDDKRLFGLSADRIPFSMGHLIVERFPILENNLVRARVAYHTEEPNRFLYELTEADLEKRLGRIDADLEIICQAMNVVCDEATGTALIEGAEAFLRSQSGI